jgi:hypothetical protein
MGFDRLSHREKAMGFDRLSHRARKFLDPELVEGKMPGLR